MLCHTYFLAYRMHNFVQKRMNMSALNSLSS